MLKIMQKILFMLTILFAIIGIVISCINLSNYRARIEIGPLFSGSMLLCLGLFQIISHTQNKSAKMIKFSGAFAFIAGLIILSDFLSYFIN